MIPLGYNFDVAESNNFRLRPRIEDPELHALLVRQRLKSSDSGGGEKNQASNRTVHADYCLFMKTD